MISPAPNRSQETAGPLQGAVGHDSILSSGRHAAGLRTQRGGLDEPRAKHGNHLFLLFAGEPWEDRQTQHFDTELFDHRQTGALMFINVGRLAMNRNGVIDDRAHTLLLQALFQPISAKTNGQSELTGAMIGT